MAAPVPYAADTRAKGWRFEIDYEKIAQSDTWSLAAELPMCQHALLMMWMVAWTQEPCGSFPNDEALIRAKCKIPTKLWPGFRDVVMRGWWLAEDGRLYHDTIVQRVQAMLDKRANDAQRAATRRARKADSGADHEGITGESRVTPPGVPPEFDTKHQAPRTINTPHKPPRGARKAAVSIQEWIRSIREKGERLMPDDDPIFDYANKAGIPRDMLVLAWDEFKARHSVEGAKKYKDWRSTFRNCVRANWYGLWMDDGSGGYKLSTKGIQAERVSHAEAVEEGDA